MSPSPTPRTDRAKVSKAEASAEDRRVAERSPGPGRESCGTTVDEGADRRGDEPGRVAAEAPLAVHLLERSRLAVRPGQLLDDERNALGLGMHRRRRRGFDRAREHPLQELGSLQRAESAWSQPSDEAHPLHVGDEVDGLGDRGELVGSDGQEQEDRLVGVAPDDVPQEPERVVVGPLDVVDEERDRPDMRKRRDRNACEIECPQELRIGRQALESGFVSSRDRLDHAPDGRLRRRSGGRPPGWRPRRRGSGRGGTARGSPRRP